MPRASKGAVHLDAEGALALLAAEEVAALLLQVLGLDAMRELDALAGALVVERQLLAAVPVGVEEAGAWPSPPPALEVPHDLDAGLGIALAVDLSIGKGRPAV